MGFTAQVRVGGGVEGGGAQAVWYSRVFMGVLCFGVFGTQFFTFFSLPSLFLSFSFPPLWFPLLISPSPDSSHSALSRHFTTTSPSLSLYHTHKHTHTRTLTHTHTHAHTHTHTRTHTHAHTHRHSCLFHLCVLGQCQRVALTVNVHTWACLCSLSCLRSPGKVML